MKKCPKCESVYSDVSLSFCLSDGTELKNLDSEKTQEFSTSDKQRVQIDLPTNQSETETVIIPPASPTQNTSVVQAPQTSKGISPFIVGLLVGLLLFVTVAFAGFIAYTFHNKNKETAQDKTSQTNLNNNQSNNPLNENTNLNNQNSKTPEKTPQPTKSPKPENTARVNSPRDGFLALRSLPNHKTGARLAKIPHGTNIKIEGCQKNRVKIGGKTGRWCRVTYGGRKGWVFDAWLRR